MGGISEKWKFEAMVFREFIGVKAKEGWEEGVGFRD